MKRKVRKLKKRIQRQMNGISPATVGIILGMAIIIALLLFFTTAQQGEIYEITEVDILSLDDFNTKNVAVKGMVLGNSLEEVIEQLGYPDKQKLFPPNVINVEYGKRFGLNETGIILHFADDTLKKITLKPPFNEFLIGKTKVGSTKEELFSLLGKPDSVEKIPLKEGSVLLMSLYTYDDLGLQLLTRRNEQNALILFA